MAHALKGYDGPCRNVHGHSYRLEVTICGNPIDSIDNPKLGMVMDFGDLKAIINKYIIDDFDHVTVLNKDSYYSSVEELEKNLGKVRLVNYQPTCENLLVEMRERIVAHLPSGVELVQVRLHETATSFAEIVEVDNRL